MFVPAWLWFSKQKNECFSELGGNKVGKEKKKRKKQLLLLDIERQRGKKKKRKRSEHAQMQKKESCNR